MPIVFSQGDDAVPLALMGLNEGVNVFVDEEGQLRDPYIYVPAYVRRYPVSARPAEPGGRGTVAVLRPDLADDRRFRRGRGAVRERRADRRVVKNILDFNQQFEEAGARTGAFMNEITRTRPADGRRSVDPARGRRAAVHLSRLPDDQRGKAAATLRGDQLRKIVQSGLLPLIYAHLFSLSVMREIFARQVQLGLMPAPQLGRLTQSPDSRPDRPADVCRSRGRRISCLATLETKRGVLYCYPARRRVPPFAGRHGASFGCASSLNLGHLVHCPGWFFIRRRLRCRPARFAAEQLVGGGVDDPAQQRGGRAEPLPAR